MAHRAVRAIVITGDKLLVMKRSKFGQQYITLVGGGIDAGEDAETALRRELREETGMEVGKARLVYVEDAGDPFGVQYVYLCEYGGGDPVLHPQSDEASINQLGQNLYEPAWLPLTQLAQSPFRSESLKQALLTALQAGFPTEPQTLVWKAESIPQSSDNQPEGVK